MLMNIVRCLTNFTSMLRRWLLIWEARLTLFVVWSSPKPNKEVQVKMSTRYMYIARLMIHVQKVEEENFKYGEEFKNKRSKTHSFEKKFWKDLLHNLLVTLHLELKVCIIVRVHNPLELDALSPKVVRWKDVMWQNPPRKVSLGQGRLLQVWTKGSLYDRVSKEHARKLYLWRNKSPLSMVAKSNMIR